MNYTDPELLDRLAAEYVLGTLRGPARRRFERLLLESTVARNAVTDWENRLAGLASALPEQQPSAAVWRGIEQRLHPKPKATWFWQVWALAASVALVFVALLLVPAQQPAVDREVAFVNAQNATPLWVVSMDFNTGELTTQAISAPAQEIDKVYELWMVPANGAPQSLGLMPVNGGRTQQTFSPALLELLRSSQTLAVSIEPVGGSPTGTPTGPVVYQAPLVDL